MMMVDTCASAPSTTKSKVKKQPKPNQRRVYDANGYRRRVDCVCFRDETRSEVMLVSSRNHTGCWTIPGGGLEPGETSRQTALREAQEEAGVNGYICDFLGTSLDTDHNTSTDGFGIIVTGELSQWMDADQCGRQRRWFSVPEVIEILRQRNKHSKLLYFDCRPQQLPVQSLPKSSVLLSPQSSLSSDLTSFAVFPVPLTPPCTCQTYGGNASNGLPVAPLSSPTAVQQQHLPTCKTQSCPAFNSGWSPEPSSLGLKSSMLSPNHSCSIVLERCISLQES